MTKAVVIAVLALAVVAGAFVGGYGLCAWQMSKGQAAQVQKMERENQRLQTRVDDQAVRLQQEKGKVHVVYRTLTKEAEQHEKTIPNRTCFGPADVRLLNAAARGKENPDVSRVDAQTSAGDAPAATKRVGK